MDDMATKSLCIEYYYESVLSDLKNSTDFKATPFFSPVPNVDLSFFFEYSFEFDVRVSDIIGEDCVLSIFRLNLVRRPSSEIPASWLMDVNLSVFHTDTTFKYYPAVSSANILEKDVWYFKTKFSGYEEGSYHEREIDEHDLMTLKCHMKIWDSSKNLLPSIRNENHLIAELKQFANDFISIYDSRILSDIEFKIDEKSVPAHKVVIAAHSPVFLKMLTSGFQESKTNSITISDSSYDHFTTFLKYLYTGEIEDQSWPNMRELYILADKYDVAVLRRQCQRIIISSLSVATVSEILILSFEFDNDDLKKAATHFALGNIKDVMRQESWKEIVESYPRIGYDVCVNFAPK